MGKTELRLRRVREIRLSVCALAQRREPIKAQLPRIPREQQPGCRGAQTILLAAAAQRLFPPLGRQQPQRLRLVKTAQRQKLDPRHYACSESRSRI